MAQIFPRGGKGDTGETLIRKPQIQESMTKEGVDRLTGFMSRPVGSRQAGPRALPIPITYFLEGARAITPTRERDDTGFKLASDKTSY